MDVALIDELIETFFFLLFFIVLSYFEMSTSEEEVWDVVVMCNSRGHSSVEFFLYFVFSVRMRLSLEWRRKSVLF